MNQNPSSQGYPPYPPVYPNNSLPPNYYNPGPPLIVAQPNQVKNAIDNIMDRHRVMNLENENQKLKEKLQKKEFKALESKIDNANEINKEMNRTQTEMLIANQNKPLQNSPTNININIQNDNKNENINKNTNVVVVATGRFKIS